MTFNKADYQARIATASGVQLTVITYEIALHYVHQAQAQMQDKESFRLSVKRAQKALENLMETLKMGSKFSASLMSLYIYVNKQLIESYFSGKAEPLEEASHILREMLDAWRQAEASQRSGSPLPILTGSTQQVFSGLTYKNGKLAEYVSQDETGGFEA